MFSTGVVKGLSVRWIKSNGMSMQAERNRDSSSCALSRMATLSTAKFLFLITQRILTRAAAGTELDESMMLKPRLVALKSVVLDRSPMMALMGIQSATVGDRAPGERRKVGVRTCNRRRSDLQSMQFSAIDSIAYFRP